MRKEKTMKKIIGMILTAAMLLSLVPAAVLGDGMPFKDVAEDAWYYDAVKFVYDHGIMNGQDVDLFAPGTNMTRAELVTVLARLSGESLDGYGEMAAPLADV